MDDVAEHGAGSTAAGAPALADRPPGPADEHDGTDEPSATPSVGADADPDDTTDPDETVTAQEPDVPAPATRAERRAVRRAEQRRLRMSPLVEAGLHQATLLATVREVRDLDGGGPDEIATATAAHERLADVSVRRDRGLNRSWGLAIVVLAVAIVVVRALGTTTDAPLRWTALSTDHLAGDLGWALLGLIVGGLVALVVVFHLLEGENELSTDLVLLVPAAIGAALLLVGPGWRSLVAGLVSGAALLLLAIGVFALAYLMVEWLVGSDPRDELLVGLGQCLAMATFGEPEPAGDDVARDDGWRTDPRARAVLVKRLSAMGSWCLTTPHGWSAVRAPEVREAVQDFRFRVAAGFSALARGLALADTRADDAVVRSVAAGYVAACRGRWTDLAECAPAASRRRVARVVTERVVVGGGLVAVALWGVPAVLEGPAADQVTGLVLAAAVVAVSSPRAAVATLRDDLAKRLRSG